MDASRKQCTGSTRRRCQHCSVREVRSDSCVFCIWSLRPMPRDSRGARAPRLQVVSSMFSMANPASSTKAPMTTRCDARSTRCVRNKIRSQRSAAQTDPCRLPSRMQTRSPTAPCKTISSAAPVYIQRRAETTRCGVPSRKSARPKYPCSTEHSLDRCNNTFTTINLGCEANLQQIRVTETPRHKPTLPRGTDCLRLGLPLSFSRPHGSSGVYRWTNNCASEDTRVGVAQLDGASLAGGPCHKLRPQSEGSEPFAMNPMQLSTNRAGGASPARRSTSGLWRRSPNSSSRWL